MCGRFTLFTPASRLAEVFLPGEVLAATPRYNITPGQPILAIRASAHHNRREFAMPRWGLVPAWARDAAIGNRLINARAETVSEKPAFRRAFRERRCLVPADGFYEWKREGPGKRPFYIRMKDGAPFAFAGIWERWEGAPGKVVETCAILTTEPNEILSPIHDRMPLILSPEEYGLWLDPSVPPSDRLARLLRPFPPGGMETYPVGRAVNNPHSEGPSCIRPADAG
ncbi:MAG TPA: SOS response-associated peptidase [Candidatus Deferrimicrobiaceae bacterium]